MSPAAPRRARCFAPPVHQPPRDWRPGGAAGGGRRHGRDAARGRRTAGKRTDVGRLEENPLDDIRNADPVRWVMKDGELYGGDTLTRIWPTRRELPPLWWGESEAGGVVTGGKER